MIEAILKPVNNNTFMSALLVSLANILNIGNGLTFRLHSLFLRIIITHLDVVLIPRELQTNDTSRSRQ